MTKPGIGSRFLFPPVLTEHWENAPVSTPTAMGICTISTCIPLVFQYSIFPSTCQDRAADAVAAPVRSGLRR